MNDLKINTPEGEKAALDVLEHGEIYRAEAKDPEKAEYFVRVKWLDVKYSQSAINEIGLLEIKIQFVSPPPQNGDILLSDLKLACQIGTSRNLA